MPKSNLLSNNFLPLHRNWRRAGGMADFTQPLNVFSYPPTPLFRGEFRHQIVDALIVQRIERGFPKPKIWVRFPVGVLKKVLQVFFCSTFFVFYMNPLLSFLWSDIVHVHLLDIEGSILVDFNAHEIVAWVGAVALAH